MSSVARWRLAAVVLGFCCIGLVYRVFDLGLTRTYLDASQEASAMHIRLLTDLIQHEWIGLPEEQVMSRLNAFSASKGPGAIVLKREPETNAIYLEGVRFEFRNGKLASVK